MTRTEHVEWCKKRALEYIEMGDIIGAYNSFQSDMMKHEETENHPAFQIGAIMLFSKRLSTAREMTNWINGFN